MRRASGQSPFALNQTCDSNDEGMTYWGFHLVFILPIIGVLGYLSWTGPPHGLPRPAWGIAFLIVMALVYTTPWDNYLVFRGVWGYDDSRISEAWKLGYVPLEEYVFFILQPILTGLGVLYFGARDRSLVESLLRPTTRSWRPRLLGLGVALLLGAWGVWALWVDARGLYFGLILVWSAPVIALHWLYGGDHLWSANRWLCRAVLLPTVYLWVVDRIAIEWQIWHISPAHSTGWNFLGLPLEEALFFFITNVFVVQGLLLYFRVLHDWRRRPGAAT